MRNGRHDSPKFLRESSVPTEERIKEAGDPYELRANNISKSHNGPCRMATARRCSRHGQITVRDGCHRCQQKSNNDRYNFEGIFCTPLPSKPQWPIAFQTLHLFCSIQARYAATVDELKRKQMNVKWQFLLR